MKEEEKMEETADDDRISRSPRGVPRLIAGNIVSRQDSALSEDDSDHQQNPNSPVPSPRKSATMNTVMNGNAGKASSKGTTSDNTKHQSDDNDDSDNDRDSDSSSSCSVEAAPAQPASFGSVRSVRSDGSQTRSTRRAVHVSG